MPPAVGLDDSAADRSYWGHALESKPDRTHRIDASARWDSEWLHRPEGGRDLRLPATGEAGQVMLRRAAKGNSRHGAMRCLGNRDCVMQRPGTRAILLFVVIPLGVCIRLKLGFG